MPSTSSPPRRAVSLAPVREVLPASCFERSALRSAAYVARDAAIYVAVLVALARTSVWWLVVPLELLAGLVVSALFVLGHDAAHGALFEDPRANRWTARLLFLPSLHVKAAWDLGHNRVHHGFTAREGMDFVWHPLTVDGYHDLPRWARARHRVEWSALGSGLYYGREVWWNKMITFRATGPRAGAIRRDWWLVVGWFAAVTTATVATGGLTLWLKLVVVPFLLFTEIIGWTVYVHHVGPEIRWWSRTEWTPRRGQMESTTVLRAPRLLEVFFHNIFVHVPHHVDTRIPWYHLPEAAAALEHAFPGTIVDRPLRLGDYVRAARTCKLYDFERGVWSGYPSRKPETTLTA